MYEYGDGALLRAATWPPQHLLPPWPDLTSPSADQESWRCWLSSIWQIPAFATAVQHASPDLAQRIDAMLDGHHLDEAAARRLVVSTMRYLLRAGTRATPFGLFAGIASARITAARKPSIRIGDAHQAILRARTAWLFAIVDELEDIPALRRRLAVVTNDLLFERDGQIVLEHRPHTRPDGAPAHVNVRATEPLRAALRLAQHPVPYESLHGRLAAMFPTATRPAIDTLLARLVRERILLTSLRPPTTTSDPLGYLLAELTAVNADAVSEAAETVKRLRAIADELAHWPHLARPTDQQEAMTRAAVSMRVVHSDVQPLACDTRLDASLTLPATVAKEAATAADVLIRLARRPALSSGWIDWHQRFLERYGPHALVPVLDVIDADTGLGYPAGYLGAPSPQPTAPTKRDTELLALAGRAALHRQHEIILDDKVIDRLSVIGRGMPVQPSTALTLRLDATTPQAIADGTYTLTILGVSRHAGTTTGRFLPLLEGDDLKRTTALCANTPTAVLGALRAQISAPPLHTSSGDVTRVPRVCRHLLPIAEYHLADDQQLAVTDLGITADAHRLYVMSRSRRRVVEPLTLNAVNPATHIHPLTRFLTEAPTALSTPCTEFDWGPATMLPFLPALRYGRTIISSARWRLCASDVPSRDASWPDWDRALAVWRDKLGVPWRVYLGEGDRRIILDLDELAHRALLRDHLRTHDAAALLPAPGPDDAGWIGGHAHELVLPLKTITAQVDPPSRFHAISGRDHGYLHGQNGRLYLKLYGHPDRHTSILLHHMPRLVELLEPVTGPLAWWFLRYHDPDEHLRIRMTVPPDTLTPVIDRVNTWCTHLRHNGLTGRVQWDTYYPEVARFGGPDAMEPAEAYFAADSAAVLAQLAACNATGIDSRAVTAASFLDLVMALIGDTASAMCWLIEHIRPDSQAPDRALFNQARTLANPDHRTVLATDPSWHDVLASWKRRHSAVEVYRVALQTARISARDLLPDLLHLNHARMLGTSPTSERTCLHLARAAASSWIAARTQVRRHS